jgi:hypothetical protein
LHRSTKKANHAEIEAIEQSPEDFIEGSSTPDSYRKPAIRLVQLRQDCATALGASALGGLRY